MNPLPNLLLLLRLLAVPLPCCSHVTKNSHLQVASYGRHVRDPLELRQIVLGEFPNGSRDQLHVSLGRAAEEQVRPRARIEQRLAKSAVCSATTISFFKKRETHLLSSPPKHNM